MTVAFIPVRGGSKSIPLKNVREIAGKPLLYWVCEAAFKAKLVDAVYISTDDDRIRIIANKLIERHWSGGKVRLIDRPPESATDGASTESAMIDFCKRIPSEIILLLQATSPLLRSGDIDGAIGLMKERGAESVLSAVRQKRFIWGWNGASAKPVNYDPAKRPRRQDWEGFFVENGALYATKTALFNKSGVRINGSTVIWEMPEESYVELDEPVDWEILEILLSARERTTVVGESPIIKLLVTDNDGVLTDGGMFYSDAGEIIKKYNTQDGMGFQLLRDAGIRTALITGEESKIAQKRAEKLGIQTVILGSKDKHSALRKIWETTGIGPHETAYIGDDINDLSAMKACAVRIAVNNAQDEIKEIAHYVTNKKGGNAGFREAVNWLLKR